MKTIVEDDIFNLFKDSILCSICKSILINPMMCIKCQNSYCKKCIDKWKEENKKCPNDCKEAEYQECKMKNDILFKLKITCVGCGKEINYNEAQQHHDSCCPHKTSADMNIKKMRKIPEIKIKKLTNEEADKYVKEGSTMTYISVITLGESHVGKTSLIETFLNGKSSLVNITTIGNPHYFVTYKLSDGSLVNVNLLDTNGQERYRSLNLSYYRQADCCLLVYDITDYNSFNECKNYYNQSLMQFCKKDIEVILLGNKSDLEEERKVSPEEGAGFALENNYIFMETSCARNDNVANAFEALIELTNIEAKKNQDKEKDKDPRKKKSVKLDKKKVKKKDESEKSGCCK